MESITYIVLNSATTLLEELTFPVYKHNSSTSVRVLYNSVEEKE